MAAKPIIPLFTSLVYYAAQNYCISHAIKTKVNEQNKNIAGHFVPFLMWTKG